MSESTGKKIECYTVASGHPLPLGVNLTPGGVRLSVFSRNATAVSLLIYASAQDNGPSREIALSPVTNRTGDIWHVELTGAGPGLLYNWHPPAGGDPGLPPGADEHDEESEAEQVFE